MPVPMPSPYCAYLRVYEPLAAFDAEERAAWQTYAGQAEPRSQRLSAEHRNALAGVLSIPPRPVPSDEPREAFVLEDFHPRSWLELDYGRLARFLGPEGLAGDRSVEEVREALAALSGGDEMAATVACRSVVDRWARVRALEHAN